MAQLPLTRAESPNVPDFDNEIFISYAHLDNEPNAKGDDGWISNLHHALEIRVAQLRGAKPRIWRDPKLQGNDVFGQELIARLDKAALLVSVLTPSYLTSEWCTRELKEFWQASEKTGGPVIGKKARVFKVVKTPVPRERMPDVVQPLLGYEFYKIDPDTGRAREMDRVFGDEAQEQFWARLNDLAYDIAGLLEMLEGEAPIRRAEDQPDSGKPAVYLAETTSDLADERDGIRRDLQRHGYTVLPDSTPPLVESRLEDFLREELGRCRVSVHLLGAPYGIVPEGGEQSIPELQNKLAQEFGKAAKLARLVWIPPGTKPTDERQRKFLEQVRTDPGLDEGADVLETPVEQLKTVIYDRLKAAEKPPERAATPAVAAKTTQLYLVCDIHDLDSIGPLQDFLCDKGFDVILPAFEGAEDELRQDHQANLRSCSALLIYYGSGSDLWLRKKLREAADAGALGRTTPITAVGVCVAAPPGPVKQRFRTTEAITIAMPGAFDPAPLAQFLTAISARAGAQGL
jgi:hypothetical protein